MWMSPGPRSTRVASSSSTTEVRVPSERAIACRSTSAACAAYTAGTGTRPPDRVAQIRPEALARGLAFVRPGRLTYMLEATRFPGHGQPGGLLEARVRWVLGVRVSVGR